MGASIYPAVEAEWVDGTTVTMPVGPVDLDTHVTYSTMSYLLEGLGFDWDADQCSDEYPIGVWEKRLVSALKELWCGVLPDSPDDYIGYNDLTVEDQTVLKWAPQLLAQCVVGRSMGATKVVWS